MSELPTTKNAFLNYGPTFSGNFLVTGIRHIGNFRSDMGEEWSSVFKCATFGRAWPTHKAAS